MKGRAVLLQLTLRYPTLNGIDLRNSCNCRPVTSQHVAQGVFILEGNIGQRVMASVGRSPGEIGRAHV